MAAPGKVFTMNRRLWRFSLLISGVLLSVAAAEDPITVHYSDPTLTRLETQVGVTAAQKDRFEDIVVKYRDAARNGSGDSSPAQAPSPDGTKRHSRHGFQNSSASSARGADGQGSKRARQSELDELATVLTPAQLKKFEGLNRATP